MLSKRLIEIMVGLFIIAGIAALFILAFKASGFSKYSSGNAMHATAVFDNIGDLKIRAPVTVAGVRIGEVDSITLDEQTFKARVSMLIDKQQDLPNDSSAAILTAGLIGANYIQITPGYSDQMLKPGGEITETHPAIILEDLIGQVIYSLKDKDKDEKK